MPKPIKKLFESFQPGHYVLSVKISQDEQTFSGTVTIDGRKAGKPSKRITLHQKGLKITDVRLSRHDKKRGKLQVEIDRVNSHAKFDELRIHTKEIAYPGQYEITISFIGRITDQMHGIYPSYYDNRRKTIISTQLESHHARELFPCVDEPEAKATFDLSLVTQPGETVIANTPISKQTKANGLMTTSFETSPLMSTYLLAFVVGDLVFREAKSKNGVVIKSYTTPDNSKMLDFSLEVGVKCLDFFEDYFHEPYPLAKLDFVALPDFSAAAMENWGLITFRESCLLADEASTIPSKQFIATCIAHEIAHQWFGNLVTMKWWDDLWLNESFATIMSYVAVDELFPQWHIWDQFVNHEMAHALRRDSLPGVQALRTKVTDPAEISSLFDPAIVYAKGAAVLNMLKNYVGEESFRKGLNTYFERHKFKNAEAKDLWNALDEACHLDIVPFMEKWLNTPGYPVVAIDHKPGTDSFTATQHRLMVGSQSLSESKSDWIIPLAPSDETDKPALSAWQSSFTIAYKSSKDSPFFVNKSAGSYFVPHYVNSDHYKLLVASVKDKSLATMDRLEFLESHLVMEKASEIQTSQLLELLMAYQDEADESAWASISAVLGSAKTLVFDDKAAEAQLKEFMAKMILPVYKEVGWVIKKDEDDRVTQLRSLILGLAISAEMPVAIAEGLKRFKKFSKPEDLSHDIRDAVYLAAIRNGQDSDFQKLLAVYEQTGSAEHKDDIVRALTATKDPKRIKQLVGMLTSGQVRLQDVRTWYVWLLRNEHARGQAWDWLVENWAWIEQNFGSDKSYDELAKYSGMIFSRASELKKFKDFFGPKRKIAALSRVIDLGIQEIEGRVVWRKLNEKSVKQWLLNWRSS